MNPASTPRRLTADQSALLDFVRGSAAILVLLGHTWGTVAGDFAFGKAHPWQSLAVGIFFWLSGFLIAYHCFTRERYSFGEYLVDRFSRIYVCLVPALVVSAVALGPMMGKPWPPLSELVANLLMLHHTPFDRISPELPRFQVYATNAVLWTIAVEWWLYALFGILFFFGRSGPAARLVMALLALPALLVVGYFTLKEYIAIVWFAGAVSAFAFVRTPHADRAALALAFAACAAGFAVRFQILDVTVPVNMYDLQLTLALAAALVLGLMLAGEMPTLALPRAFVRFSAYIAFLSYSLYLVHDPIRRLIIDTAGWRPLTHAQALLTTVAALAFCAAFAWAFENRHLAVRRFIKQKLKLGISRAAGAEALSSPARDG